MVVDVHTHQWPAGEGFVVYNLMIKPSVDVAVPSSGWFSAGIHPWDAGFDDALPALESLLVNERCVALGETGLDHLKGPVFSRQLTVFRRQLVMAARYHKPVVVHSVRSQEEVIGEVRRLHLMMPVVIHGFCHRSTVAARWLAEGYFLSFGAALIDASAAVKQSLRTTPLNRLFFETDDADVPIEVIYGEASAILQIDVVDLYSIVKKNFNTVFLNGKLA